MLAVVAAVTAALGGPMALAVWRRRRDARAVPRTPIAGAPEGRVVRVVGVVADAPGLLRAPLTGRRCAGYEATIEEDVARPAYRMTLARERAQVELTIHDGTGRAIVELATAAIFDEVGLRVGRPAVSEPAVAAMLARAQPRPTVRGPLRWRERALEVGATVAVIGVAVREPDPAAVAAVTGYRAGPPTRLRFTGSPARPVLVSDDPDLQA